MVPDWSPQEDLRPGVQMLRVQPEKTARGQVWTQLIWFELDGKKYYTQLTIRDCQDEWLLGHGRVWPLTGKEDENDGA